MGLRDAEEMLEAAKADAVGMERDIARLRAERDATSLQLAAVTRQRDRARDAIRQIRALTVNPRSLSDYEDASYDVVLVDDLRPILEKADRES